MKLGQRHRSRIFIAAGCVLVSLGLPISGRTRVKTAAKHSTAAASESTATAGRVTEIRFFSLGDATRIAIELDSEFRFKSDRLANPDRLFFDIIGVKPQGARKGIQTIAVGDNFLKQIRVAETQPGTTRVVLDLAAGAEFKASQLTHPERLMIELRAAGKPDAAAATAVEHKVFQPPASRQAVILEPGPASGIDPPRPVAARIDAPVFSAIRTTLPPAPVLMRETTPRETIPRETPKETPRELARATSPRMPASTPSLPAKKTTAGEASLTRVLGLKLGRIVIDAGHGGHDVGTQGPSGLLEKELVLDVTRRLGALIEARLGSEVIYTRSDDTYVPLEQRTRLANDNKADLFLSVHANSSPIRGISGVETYYLNFTTSKTALDVAARENAGSERSIYDLKDLLQKIALKDKVDESREFAAKVQTSLQVLSARTNSHARDRGVKKAPFVVLIGASMPSILAEIGFLTNTHDEALMKRSDYRQKIAEALYRGVSQYASGLSHYQVARKE